MMMTSISYSNIAGAPWRPNRRTCYCQCPKGYFRTGLQGQGYLSVLLFQVKGGDEVCSPEVVHEVIQIGDRVAVKLCDLVEPLEVIANSEAAV